MEKLRDSDITKEDYEGPGPAITALGRATWAHLVLAAELLAGVTLAGLALPKPTKFAVDGVRNWARKLSESEVQSIGEASTTFGTAKKFVLTSWNNVKETTGNIFLAVFGRGEEEILLRQKERLKEVSDGWGHTKESIARGFENRQHGFGYWLINHTVGELPLGPLRKSFRIWYRNINERLSNALSLGGAVGIIGYLVSPVYYAFRGIHDAFKGKDQFERAKDEIIDLRNAYARTKLELDDLKTAKDAATGTLTVAKDDPPSMRTETAPATPTPMAAAESRDAGNGKVEPPPIREPEIKEPPIKEPNFPQTPNKPWGDKIAAQHAAAEMHEPTRA